MKPSPKLRITKIAKVLFYENGYYHTGINQIIKESETAKASFYDHFPSKEDLGILVIRSYGKDILIWFRSILRKSPDPKEFAKNLKRAVRDQIRSQVSYYQGCPIAVFSCQFPVGKQPFCDEFKSIALHWESVIEKKLFEWKEKKMLPKDLNVKATTKRIINLYEGSLINWRITLDESYLNEMDEQIKELLFKY